MSLTVRSEVGQLLIGMGERTTPMAVEILACTLFADGQAAAVIAVKLPKSDAMMQLDTLMTMVATLGPRP
jgi:arginine deiminase